MEIETESLSKENGRFLYSRVFQNFKIPLPVTVQIIWHATHATSVKF